MGEAASEAFDSQVVRPALGLDSAPVSTWKRWTGNVASFFTGRPALTTAGVTALGTAAAAHALGAGEAIPADSILQNLGNAGIAAGAGLAAGAAAGLATKGIVSLTAADKLIQDADVAVADAAKIAASETTASAEAARAAENSSGRNLKNVPAVAAAGRAAVAAADEVQQSIDFFKQQRARFAATRTEEDAILFEDSIAAVIDALNASAAAVDRAAEQTEIAAESVLAHGYAPGDPEDIFAREGGERLVTEEDLLAEEQALFNQRRRGRYAPPDMYQSGQVIMKKSPSKSPKRRSPPKSSTSKRGRSSTASRRSIASLPKSTRSYSTPKKSASPKKRSSASKSPSIASLAKSGRVPRTPQSASRRRGY